MSSSLFLFTPPIFFQRHYPPCSFLLFLLLVTTSYAAPYPESRTTSNFHEYILQNVFYNQDQCYKDSFVYIKQTDSAAGAFKVLAKTKECADRLAQEGSLPSKLPYCPPGLIDFDVKPVYVPKSQISYPYANLNISITAHSSVDTIAFRLECLSASDGQDMYCSNNKAMFLNGVKQWPCRGLHLSSSVHYPARFSYSCFRLTPHSVYAINATILPQLCRAVQFVTAPSFRDMFPEVLMDPMDNEELALEPFWSPLLSVDVSDPSGVWIRFGKADLARCDKMMVNIYKESKTDSSKVIFVKTLEVKCPDDAVKWENLLAGRYLLTAYVPIRGCKFMCEPDERRCEQCLRTHLNVYIEDDKASLYWIALQTFNDSSSEILIAAIIVAVIVIVSMLIWLCMYLYKNYKEAQQTRSIPLKNFVKTMVVYADDHASHLKVIRLFVECLRNCATCDPIYDVEKLLTLEPVVPSRWLIDQIATAPKFAIVLSDCAVKILDTAASTTHHLVQNRPFADLFGPAMELIIRDATHNSAAARQKYAIVRLPYSPEVPANLALLGFPMFNLPQQFSNLVAFLHDVPLSKNTEISQMLPQQRITEWTRACGQVQQFVETTPNWIETRWRPKDEPVRNFQSLAPIAEEERILTHEDRVRASKKYGLHPPGEDSDEEEGPADETTYMLHPKKTAGEEDSDSESDSDDSNKTLKPEDVNPEELTSSDSPMNTVVYLGSGPMPGTQKSVEKSAEPTELLEVQPAESTGSSEEKPAEPTVESEEKTAGPVEESEQKPAESIGDSEEKPANPTESSEEKPTELIEESEQKTVELVEESEQKSAEPREPSELKPSTSDSCLDD